MTIHRQEHAIDTDQRTIRIVEDGLSYFPWRKSETTSRPHNENAVLSRFAQFLETCPPEAFRQAVQALYGETSAASVWARAFGIAADRPGIADDLLWSVASKPATGKIIDLARDAATYLASIYPTTGLEQRMKFETLLVDQLASTDDKAVMEHWTARLLSVLPDGAIATEALRQLKVQLAASGDLTGNRPLMQMNTSWQPAAEATNFMLANQGVDVNSAPDKEALAVKRALSKLMERSKADETAETIIELWAAATAAATLIENLKPAPHEATLHAVCGVISNALERIAHAEAYDPTHTGHPTLVELSGLVDRLAESPHPEHGSDTDTISWGNWDVRVYVASSLMSLARRWGRTNPDLLERASNMLNDAVPTVRHQISASLDVLWNVDRPRMWALMHKVAGEETNIAALAHFAAGPLSRVAEADCDNGEQVLSRLVDRFPVGVEEMHNDQQLDQAIGGVTAVLYVGHGRARSGAYIDKWLEDLATGAPRLRSAMSTLRDALFLRYKPGASEADGLVQDRAREVLRKVIHIASEKTTSAAATLNVASTLQPDRSASEQLYKAAALLLEHCCNQLYFGAGAFRNGDEREEPGLPSVSSKRSFLAEYQPLLDEIAHAGPPSALHHLAELYEFLADADPELVFDKLASMLVGPAALQGYQYESLATGVIVCTVRRYLADHRSIFEDPERRTSLISVLELFSNAGWPEALKLLYELPDILR